MYAVSTIEFSHPAISFLIHDAVSFGDSGNDLFRLTLWNFGADPAWCVDCRAGTDTRAERLLRGLSDGRETYPACPTRRLGSDGFPEPNERVRGDLQLIGSIELWKKLPKYVLAFHKCHITCRDTLYFSNDYSQHML